MIEYKTIRCELNETPQTGNYYVITSYGHQYWVVNNKLHRDNDLPAIIYNDGDQFWYQNNKQHRFNNPAIICDDGYVEYWYDNKEYTRQEYFDLMLAKGLISEKEHFAKLL